MYALTILGLRNIRSPWKKCGVGARNTHAFNWNHSSLHILMRLLFVAQGKPGILKNAGHPRILKKLRGLVIFWNNVINQQLLVLAVRRAGSSLQVVATSHFINGRGFTCAINSNLLKVVSAEFYFHKPITVHLELYLFYCFIHFLLYIGQYWLWKTW